MFNNSTSLGFDEEAIKRAISERSVRMRAATRKVFDEIHESINKIELSSGLTQSDEFYGVGDKTRATGELSDLFKVINHQVSTVPYFDKRPYVGPEIPEYDRSNHARIAASTASFDPHFPVLGCSSYVEYTDADPTSGEVITRPFYIFSQQPEKGHYKVPVVFYIPGTALQFENSPTSNITASHLKYVLEQQKEPDTNVVLLTHRLCPEVEWPTPLEDVIRVLAAYIKQYEPLSITISGYSSGGMLAVLAAIDFLLNDIPIKNILLFAPLFDITREFRSVNSSGDPFYRYLPSQFHNEAGLKLLATSKTLAENDTIINGSVIQMIMGSMFTLSPVAHHEIYRSASVLWNFYFFNDKKKFPPVVIIIGTHDHFLPEVEIFRAMLAQDGCASLLVKVLGGNHGIFWKHLFTTYLMQALFTAQANQEVNLSEIDTKEIREKEEEIKRLESNSEKIKPKCLELYQMVGALFLPPPRPAAQTALSGESVAAPGLT